MKSVLFCEYISPLGKIIMQSNGIALTGLFFDGQRFLPKEKMDVFSKTEIFAMTEQWLDDYFCGKEPKGMPPIEFDGATDFQRRVWEQLLCIPYGQTMSYGDIAKLIFGPVGKKASAQAVGGAVGRNPIAIIVPCHRVMGADGGITGYGAGINRKIALLKLEKAFREAFYLPKDVDKWKAFDA